MYVSDYNRELYEAVRSRMDEGCHRIFYSEATGLGKSIIMQLLISGVFAERKILYISPKYSIWDNLSGYEAMSGVDCCMYAAFHSRQAAEEIIGQYDVVFIDECHHMYSDVFGMNIQNVMRSDTRRYYIGFTATPKLKRKLANEAFEASCFGLDIYDAVQRGIFPRIKYAVLVPEHEGHIFDRDVMVQVQEILGDSEKENLKCLLYFTNVQELLDFAEDAKGYFSEYAFMCIHSKQPKTKNKEMLGMFNAYQGKAMLLSVDSLLEGVHLSGVNCVVLFRHTQSLNVFLQVTGRLCRPYSKEEPLFIDVADSLADISFDLDKVRDRTGTVIQRSLKDIINVHCREYRYVEFYERLRSKDAKLYTYRGYTWCSNNDLGRQLGVSGSAIVSWLQRNIGSTTEDYIDFKLKQKTLYKGVDCSSIKAVAVALHKSEHDVKLVMDLNSFNRQQYIDFILNGGTLEQYNDKLGITYYSGVDCYNDLSVARSLRLDFTQVRKGIKMSGGKMAYIDSILQGRTLEDYLQGKTVSKRFCYKGIRYDNEVDVCEQIGVTLKTYRTFMRKTESKTPRAFIDAYVPGR